MSVSIDTPPPLAERPQGTITLTDELLGAFAHYHGQFVTYAQLHAALDDGNLDDGATIIAEAEAERWAERVVDTSLGEDGFYEHHRALGIALAHLLAAMTLEQRQFVARWT